MRLFVDDIRQPPEGWELARTVSKAIRLLDEQDVEEISIDHDIACYLYSGQSHTSNETFEAVARFVARMPVDRRPKIVYVHTANVVAGNRMVEILKTAEGDLDVRRDWSFGEPHMRIKDWERWEEEREKRGG